MTSQTFIGVDPGASGGFAWSNRHGVFCSPMPGTRREIRDLVESILEAHELSGSEGEPVAYIEKITGYIPGGGASQMFQFGVAVERVGCILETLDVRLIEVTPQKWQKSLGLGCVGRIRAPKGATAEEKKSVAKHNALAKKDWKNKLKSEAYRRFPGTTISLKTSDALLILDYAIQNETHPTQP